MINRLGLAGLVLAGSLLAGDSIPSEQKPLSAGALVPVAEQTFEKSNVESTGYRNYSLKELLVKGDYELRLNNVTYVTTAHKPGKTYTKKPYLEFIDLNNKEHIIRMSIDFLNPEKKYGISIDNGKSSAMPVMIDFNEQLPNLGKVIGNVSSKDKYLIIISYK
jgi:hypothetical protein